MREPRRLLEQDATDAERVLLQSAHRDGPPAAAAQRMLLALEGLTATSGGPSASESGQALGGSTSAVAAQSMKLGALAKVGLAALLGAGALGGGALLHGLTSKPAASVESPAASAPVPQAAPLAPAPRPSVPAAPEVVPRQPTLADDALRSELRVLDTARVAVEARDPAAAQRALDGYARRFPRGHLKPEAAVLHLAVLVQQDERAAAKALAKQLLASETYRAYGPRIRSLLREAED
jgi:hypothetical protein